MARKETGAAEALQRIREAEAKARAIVEETRNQTVPAIIEAAREEAQKTAQAIIQQAKEMAERSKQAIINQAREEAEAIRRERERELEAIDKIAGEKFELACQSIRDQILQELIKMRE